MATIGMVLMTVAREEVAGLAGKRETMDLVAVAGPAGEEETRILKEVEGSSRAVVSALMMGTAKRNEDEVDSTAMVETQMVVGGIKEMEVRERERCS